MSYEDQTEYAFRYTDCEGKVYNTTIEKPGPTWMEALDDFVGFLESVYKYDIRSKIRLHEDQELKDAPWSYIDPWKGEYFTVEEEEDTKEETMYEPSRHFSWDE
jgi:hypothetical protein